MTASCSLTGSTCYSQFIIIIYLHKNKNTQDKEVAFQTALISAQGVGAKIN